ncbi:MAG: Nramp family divalent metal transporter [Candidatus Kapaibacteriales bacterium]
MFRIIKSLIREEKPPRLTALDIWRYVGPGFLVTVGFIDPGNWASNVAAGSSFGYNLLWMVTLSTIMLIVLQHNSAHLGIVTGLCLSEAITFYFGKIPSKFILASAVLAAISTAVAEILGGAIALRMLFGIPLNISAIIVFGFVIAMIFTNSYRKIERWIIGFVSIIGLSFIYELALVDVHWGEAAIGWVVPNFPESSIVIIMSVLGAVVMPHNLFLHSEIIQSRQWNLTDEYIINHQLKFEFYDTLLAMIVGWAINSAMILLSASTFFSNGIVVEELEQAQKMLEPLLGSTSSFIFAIALLFAGVASSITAGMSGGILFAGIFGEPYDIEDKHTRIGVLVVLSSALLVIFLLQNPFQGLIISQMILSIQLPITIFSQIALTSSKKVMGKFANKKSTTIILLLIGVIVTALNISLFASFFFS